MTIGLLSAGMVFLVAGAELAALDGRAGIALGNVIGSNIFNVLLILGLSALITPLAVYLKLIRTEVPIMIAVSVLLVVLGWNGQIGRVEDMVA